MITPLSSAAAHDSAVGASPPLAGNACNPLTQKIMLLLHSTRLGCIEQLGSVANSTVSRARLVAEVIPTARELDSTVP